nr:N-acetyl-gamma-glutamyl-phosphate reductase [uncultured Solibaculum sp.]
MDKIKVGVIGATGYAGLELVRLLLSHPDVEVEAVSSVSFKGKKISEIYPQLTGLFDKTLTDDMDVVNRCQVVFGSLPHGLSEPIARRCVDDGKLFIDMGADFRLKKESDYTQWYGGSYQDPDLHKRAVYSIPELHRRLVPGAKLIANPGCYVTSVCLGLAPLYQNKAVLPDSLIIDAKSGATGAGRGLSLSTHYTECNEAFAPYKVASHRHTPEMEQVLSELNGAPVTLTFVPHLLAVNRGIVSTMYLVLAADWEEDKVRRLYEDFYHKERFVKLLPKGCIANLKNVKYSNYCHISLHSDVRTHRLIVVSTIDNMVKGAAGQAIQNMNLALGLREETGLCMTPPAF